MSGHSHHASKTWVVSALLQGDFGDNLADLVIDELLAIARVEGVLPLLEWRLRTGPGWGQLPASLQEGLAGAAREAAVRDLFRVGELRKIAKMMEREGHRALLLKGNALGQWLYPKSYLRVSADIDLLLASREVAEQVASASASLGYALQFSPTGINHEMTARLLVDGICQSELDLHSRLLDAAAYADIFPFEELWSEAIPLPALGRGVMGLAPRHALAHACLNRALDMQIGVPDRLKLLYDIHLLVERMDAAAWRQFLEMARSKGICGICLRSINDTVASFHSLIPADALDVLRHGADNEPIDWRRLDDWRYMQWQNLKALPGYEAKIRWVWERVFPTRSHLRELHGEGNWFQLMGRRFRRGALRVSNKD